MAFATSSMVASLEISTACIRDFELGLSSMTRRGLPGWLALVLTILVVVLVLALVIATVFFSVTKLAVELPAYLADAAATAANDLPSAVTGSAASVSTTQYTTELGPLAQGLITTTLELLAQFGMALFIFFFMISAAIALPGAARLGLNRAHRLSAASVR